MRRFENEKGLLDRIKRMANGEEPVDMEAIKYIDLRKVSRTVERESSEDSDSESDEWENPQQPVKSTSKRRRNSISDTEDNLRSSRSSR